jgi:steroid delta-isomerase-like uncharacterized protein
MTTQEVLALNKAVIDAWNSHQSEKFTALCDDNVVWRDIASPEAYKGKQGAKQFYELWNTAFPDFKMTILNTVANETSVACEMEFAGKNSGPLRMPGQPEIPATGKTVKSKGTYFAKVKNGKVSEVKSYPDMIGMMTQLGLMQEQHA